MRSSLGASRSRLLLVDTALLVALGGLLALVVGVLGDRMIRSLLLPTSADHGSFIDHRLLVFTLIVTTTTAFLGSPPDCSGWLVRRHHPEVAQHAHEFGIRAALGASAARSPVRCCGEAFPLVSVSHGLRPASLIRDLRRLTEPMSSLLSFPRFLTAFRHETFVFLGCSPPHPPQAGSGTTRYLSDADQTATPRARMVRSDCKIASLHVPRDGRAIAAEHGANLDRGFALLKRDHNASTS